MRARRAWLVGLHRERLSPSVFCRKTAGGEITDDAKGCSFGRGMGPATRASSARNNVSSSAMEMQRRYRFCGQSRQASKGIRTDLQRANARLRNLEPASPNRHGLSAAREIPMRVPLTI